MCQRVGEPPEGFPRVLFDTVNERNRNVDFEETGEYEGRDPSEKEEVIDPTDMGIKEQLALLPKHPVKYV